jgi:hypothetical protein
MLELQHALRKLQKSELQQVLFLCQLQVMSLEIKVIFLSILISRTKFLYSSQSKKNIAGWMLQTVRPDVRSQINLG